MNLFDLAAKITLDTSQYESGIKNAEKKASSFASKLKTGLATAGKITAAAVGAVAAGVTAASAAMSKAVSDVAKYGDNIDKMSQKMGMSIAAYQEWDFVMQHNGTTIESLKASMKTLSTAAENGNKAFERLGISQDEIASMNSEQLFDRTIKALQSVKNETERTYLTGQLLGRGATELGALLNMSAEELEEMKKQAHDLGGVMSDESVKASAKYQDSLQNLQTILGGLKNRIVGEFLPGMTSVMDGITAIFSGDKDGGIAKITSGIENMTNRIAENIPVIIDVVLPAVWNAAVTIVKALFNYAMDTIKTTDWVQVGRDIIEFIKNIDWTALIQGLSSLTGGIVGAILGLLYGIFETVIKDIGNWLYENFGDAADLTWEGFIESLGRVFANIGTWVMKNIVEPLIKGFCDALGFDGDAAVQAMYDWFGDMGAAISEFVENATKTFWNIVDAVKRPFEQAANFVKKAIDKIKGLFNFKWEFPKLKMPHFSWSWEDIGGIIKLPKINVEWYRKAYDQPYLFDRPTVIGNKGFGDGNGAEMVYGRNNLMRDIRAAVESDPITIVVQSVLDGRVIGETAYKYSREKARVTG